MKTITATKFMRGNTKAAYDLVCAHSPVLITSEDRPDIAMVLANDFEDMRIKAQCYDTVKHQRDEPEVKVTMLTSLIDEVINSELSDEVKEIVRLEMIRIGV